MLIEVDEFRQGVVPAAVGVAGAVGQLLELAKGGASGAGAERGHDVRQRGDGLLMKQVDDRGGRVLGRSHCGTITKIVFVMVPQCSRACHRKRRESRHPAIAAYWERLDCVRLHGLNSAPSLSRHSSHRSRSVATDRTWSYGTSSASLAERV